VGRPVASVARLAAAPRPGRRLAGDCWPRRCASSPAASPRPGPWWCAAPAARGPRRLVWRPRAGPGAGPSAPCRRPPDRRVRERLKDAGQVIGSRVRVTVVKNKVAGPFRTVSVTCGSTTASPPKLDFSILPSTRLLTKTGAMFTSETLGLGWAATKPSPCCAIPRCGWPAHPAASFSARPRPCASRTLARSRSDGVNTALVSSMAVGTMKWTVDRRRRLSQPVHIVDQMNQRGTLGKPA
jgi:hypothetical protein